MSNPCCVWDFTCSCAKINLVDLKKWCINNCKKWCFQKEVSKSGFEHFQGRVSLKRKMRLSAIIDNSPTTCHWSPTSNENRKNDFYVTKDDTRVDGPWSDELESKKIFVPRQIANIKNWFPWQKSVIDLCDTWDPRCINLLIEKKGNVGKSSLCCYLDVFSKAINIPFINDYKDLMRSVMDQEKIGAYTFDMPRAMKKDKLFQLYGAIETIKSGYAFDDRYKFTKCWFDSPAIIIFSNNEPDLSLLSKDRWKLWTINKDKELVPYIMDGNESSSSSNDDEKHCEVLCGEEDSFYSTESGTEEVSFIFAKELLLLDEPDCSVEEDESSCGDKFISKK